MQADGGRPVDDCEVVRVLPMDMDTAQDVPCGTNSVPLHGRDAQLPRDAVELREHPSTVGMRSQREKNYAGRQHDTDRSP